jgi:hypothetical protein
MRNKIFNAGRSDGNTQYFPLKFNYVCYEFIVQATLSFRNIIESYIYFIE